MPAKKDATKEIAFAEAFRELEALTEWFESENIDLDEGITKFERGLELAQLCKKKLSAVEQKVTTLKEKFDQLNAD